MHLYTQNYNNGTLHFFRNREDLFCYLYTIDAKELEYIEFKAVAPRISYFFFVGSAMLLNCFFLGYMFLVLIKL